MQVRPAHLTLLIALSGQLFAQSDLSITKFRFKKYDSSKFERLVLEFSGPNMSEEVGVEKTEAGDKQNVTLTLKNVALVGSIPENNMNESYQKEREWIGPLSFNVDKHSQSVTIRTYLSKEGSNVDAFWLSGPTRLVIDAYPKNSPRASSRQMEADERKPAAAKLSSAPKAQKAPKESKESDNSIYCFPASSQLNPMISFHPWSGSSTIPVKTEQMASLPEKVTESIQCFSGRSRVFPEVFFNKDGAPEKRSLSSDNMPSSSMPMGNSSVPSSLGTKLEPKKGANPLNLLPPLN